MGFKNHCGIRGSRFVMQEIFWGIALLGGPRGEKFMVSWVSLYYCSSKRLQVLENAKYWSQTVMNCLWFMYISHVVFYIILSVTVKMISTKRKYYDFLLRLSAACNKFCNKKQLNQSVCKWLYMPSYALAWVRRMVFSLWRSPVKGKD